MASLPPHLEQQRRNVSLGEHTVAHGSSFSSHSAFSAMQVDNSLSLDAFRDSFDVEIHSHVVERNSDNLEGESRLVFDVKGVDGAVANALRRVLLAEVPSMALERVFIANNTSLVQDEVLAHRLGLVALRADARLFQRPETQLETKALDVVPPALSDTHLRFRLQAEGGQEGRVVRACELQWEVQEGQEAMDVRVVHPQTPIAKLAPGQAIDLVADAVRGVGRQHAKWSPCATASYRLLPDVQFARRLEAEEGRRLVQACPMQVFDMEDMAGVQVARVAAPRECTMCRACVAKPFGDAVKLERVRDVFVFTIESTGALDAAELFREALGILVAKCKHLTKQLEPEDEAKVEADVEMEDA